MSDASLCQARTLAQRGAIRIDLCSCGQVHLTVGALTLRLAAPALAAINEVVHVALARLDPPGAELAH